MKPRISAYEASGGRSELWSYENGEGLMIELHGGSSAALAWSANIPASLFMREVGALVVATSVAKAELSVDNGRQRVLPFSRAVAAVEKTGKQLRSIAVDAGDDSFTWEARDITVHPAPFPEVPGEVAISFAAYNRDFIAHLIMHTATPQVQADIADILASAERLLATTSPIAA